MSATTEANLIETMIIFSIFIIICKLMCIFVSKIMLMVSCTLLSYALFLLWSGKWLAGLGILDEDYTSGED